MPRTAQTKRPPPKPPSSSSGSQNVALGGCDFAYQSDVVRVDNLPVVDIWSQMRTKYGAHWVKLVTRNSTCYSKAWGELAADRLKHHGLTCPWMDSSAKSFAGLGCSTNTLGKRNLPFCIQVGEDSLAGAMESHEVDTDAFNPLPLLRSLVAQAKLGLIKDVAQCRCYIGDLEVPMARCSHTGLLLICLSQLTRRSKLPRVVENLRVPSPGTRAAFMLAPNRWHFNGYVSDPSGPLNHPDQKWPDLMLVTAGVKHCFPHDYSPHSNCRSQDHFGEHSPTLEPREGSRQREELYWPPPGHHRPTPYEWYGYVPGPIDLGGDYK